jgi:hypothetical protein
MPSLPIRLERYKRKSIPLPLQARENAHIMAAFPIKLLFAFKNDVLLLRIQLILWGNYLKKTCYFIDKMIYLKGCVIRFE